jgi:type II secretory pathway component GspD/PulD (secretin)/tetratricopeptide (TPR) repeat protein
MRQPRSKGKEDSQMKNVKWTLWAIAFVLAFTAGTVLAEEPAAPPDEGAPAPVPAPQPPEETAPPAPPQESPSETPDNMEKLLEIDKQAGDQTAEFYFNSGRARYQELRYREAARDFEKACRLAPDKEDYREWYMKTLWILGDRKGEIADVARTLIDERRVAINQAKVEMEREFVEAYRLYRDKKYGDAIKRFERVMEMIKWFPYFIDQKDFENKTKHYINSARLKAVQMEKRKQDEEKDVAIKGLEAEKAESLRFLRMRIRALVKQAQNMLDLKKWDKCERLCNDILRLEPDNDAAMRLKDAAIRYRHINTQMKTLYDKIKYKKIAIDYVHRAAVPYMFLIEYPDEEEWKVICQRDIPLEMQAKKSETEEEIHIKSKLENQKVTLSFTDTPFAEAINFLRDITGLNIVIAPSVADVIQAEDLRINLKIKDVRLKNALALILQVKDEFKYKIKNGVIYITTEANEADEMFLEFYNVSELIRIPPNFPAPELALRDWGGTRNTGTSLLAGPGSGGSAPVLQLDDENAEIGPSIGADALEALVKKIAGDEGVEMHAPLLVVRKSLEGHRKIQKLLEMLKRTVGMMVAVEARFVDLQINFLEEIGINLTGGGGTISGTLVGNVPTGYIYQIPDPPVDLRVGLVNAFSQPVNVTSFPFNITNQGGSAIQFNMVDGFQIQAIIDAVQKHQKAHIMYAPKITVFNTQRSHVCALYQTAYLEDVTLDATGAIPLLNPVIGILHHGSIMEARPVISYDKKYVLLEAKPTLAINQRALARQRQVTLGPTNVTITLPYLTVQKVRSTVLVPDGGIVLAGGMKDLREFHQISTMPLIGHLPIIHFLFERRGETRLKRNVVVLVKADIIILREEEEKRFGFTQMGEKTSGVVTEGSGGE